MKNKAFLILIKRKMEDNLQAVMKELRDMSFADFKKHILELDAPSLRQLKEVVDDLYYNTGEDTFEDYKYDFLKDTYSKVYPRDPMKVGATLREGENRVQLPYWLGSMDKIYPEDKSDISKWNRENPSSSYFISEKLDGVSCLLVVTDGEVNLYTRGDGEIGADISYLQNYVKGIPSNIKKEEGIAVRGELIISKDDFQKFYSKKYANARNLVSGIVNAKSLKEGSKHVNFVAYELIDPGMNTSIQEQFEKLQKNKFKTAKYVVTDEIDIDFLQQTLIDMKRESEYEMDGIIVQSNEPYFRVSSGNPSYAFAFKMLLENAIVETSVVKVEWNLSKRGQLKPRLQLVPIKTSGVTITYATAFNAKYVWENNLGPGAIVKVTRSGDVIPYIISVVQGAEEPQMPVDIDWRWNETHVDILTDSQEKELCVQLVVNFFSTFGIKFVSEATVTKLFENGFDTLMKIIRATPQELGKVEGLGQKSANRIVSNIHDGLQKVRLHQLMAASGVFGFGIGEKKLRKLLLQYPEILKVYMKKGSDDVKNKLLTLEGFSDKTADKIIDGIPAFFIFLRAIKPYIQIKKQQVVQQRFKDMKIVMTGFRDQGLQEIIENEGGQVTTSVSKNTSMVIAANPHESTGKAKTARSLGVQVFSRDEFNKKFFSGGLTTTPVSSNPFASKKKLSPVKSGQKTLDEMSKKNDKSSRILPSSFLPKSTQKKKEIEDTFIMKGKFNFDNPFAIFDFDGTLVKPNGARPFPKDKDDWTFFRSSVPEKIKNLIANDYQIVIVTDQSKSWKIDMIKEVIRNLELENVGVIIGTMEESKKPHPEYFLESIPEFEDRKNPLDFYVGDAAGRKGDWSDVDKKFAENLGLDFHTPEDFFESDEMVQHEDDFAIEEPEVVIMTGLPASGKSYFVNKFLVPHGYYLVDGDIHKTSKKMMTDAEKALSEGSKSVVFTATNLTREKRKEYIDFAKRKKMRVRCFWIDSPIEDILDRNKARPSPVPPVAIYSARKRLEPPSSDEGCTVVRIEQ